MSNLLFIVLVLIMIGALPLWPYSMHWGYYPGGGVGLLLAIAIFFMLSNRRSLN